LLHQSCRRESSSCKEDCSCRKQWKWQKRIEKKKKDKQEEERRGVFVVSENRFVVAEFAKLSHRNWENLEQVVGIATLAVPAAASLVASLRRSNVVQQQDGGRVTSVVVVLPVATSNCNLSLPSLHYGTGIHQHRWPVVVHFSPLMRLRFFTISLMILCCWSFCYI
jgi:hypothetical protein